MTAESTTHRLADGTSLPLVGFGTYPLRGEEGVAAMVSALQAGYRYLDTAVNYENEAEVGEALRRSGLPREQVTVATKVPGRDHERERALESLRGSAARLGVEQIDVALIHWPNPGRGLYPQAWQALVEAQREGLVRTIGVSNFTEDHLTRVIEETGVTPALNQVEMHPLFPQERMRAVHARLGILTQAWSPLGKRQAPFDAEPVLAAARAHDVTPGQVILRWHLELGSMPLPKSATPHRQRENLEVTGFRLTAEEVAAVSALGRADGRLFGGDPDTHEEM
ncbi:aldo/keto reductase [Phycicoccus endophyticus]|uniref:Aldo/keto reductase n=1 Tax=Phycicoccus endophyticus TaxID=1690220 RepID=A0A7G9R1D6_9MICO|nr:aldo/keto reductase [Phycicoccus endophyticus]NHI18807.1 aldo/keto reductase [Phycicoccus endophyticus]QNN49411.1 aldo/keto reductase [Phycicoccus endophyticus]GGL36409.1 oxidoreductase [Phycicoccus endophyticus]